MSEETCEGMPLACFTMIDDWVRLTDELLEILPHTITRKVAAGDGKIRGNLSVKVTERLEIVGREAPFLPTISSTLQKGFQLLPPSTPIPDERAGIRGT